jgi:hypothetical protein
VDVAPDADPDETVALQRVVVPDKTTMVPVAAAGSSEVESFTACPLGADAGVGREVARAPEGPAITVATTGGLGHRVPCSDAARNPRLGRITQDPRAGFSGWQRPTAPSIHAPVMKRRRASSETPAGGALQDPRAGFSGWQRQPRRQFTLQ